MRPVKALIISLSLLIHFNFNSNFMPQQFTGFLTYKYTLINTPGDRHSVLKFMFTSFYLVNLTFINFSTVFLLTFTFSL